MSVLREELLECLKDIESRSRTAAGKGDPEDQVTLQKLASNSCEFEDEWERIRFLARICLLFHSSDNESDASNTFRAIARLLRAMARQSQFSESPRFLTKLLALERSLSPVLIETQSDPAAILGICFHVLLSNSHTKRARNLPEKRELLLRTIDEVLEIRFRTHSSDEQIRLHEAKLRKLRSDVASIPLTVGELVAHYMSED